jgi:Flp pilus assembly protein TadG
MRAMASRTLQLFQRDERGAIIIVFAFALILLLGIIGGAVDYGKWLKAKNATQAAMDAAVLAAGRVLQLPGATESEALVAAQKYYDENKPGLLNPDNVTFQTALQGTEIIATSAASGVATPFLGVMGISSLPVNTTSKARLAASKNNGTDVEISMMLDTTGSMSGQKMADLKQAAKDLIDIVVWPDQSSYTSKVALAPFSKYVNVGTANFTAITGQTAGGGTDERTCVKERSNSDRYTDESPTVGGFFDRYTGTSTCKPTATIMPLSNEKVALKAHVDAFPATGTTAGHLGTGWAWYLLSPNWSNVWPGGSVPKPYSLLSQTNGSGQPKLRKIAILMTDGEYNKWYSGDDSTTQARTLCTNIKAEGIEVYTVGFAISVNSTPDVTMQQCATSSSHYYNASDGAALKAAFRDIALKISTLRLSE